MPLIADPVDDAERGINVALKRLDLNVLRAVKDCKGGDWERSVTVPMRGPGFLSLTITDSMFCKGSAHPDSGTFSIVYDLTTGKPVDWTQLLPASLTGTVVLEEQGDGTRSLLWHRNGCSRFIWPDMGRVRHQAAIWRLAGRLCWVRRPMDRRA